MEAIDEVTLIEGFQKVANRITMGLVLAALIIGASQLMQIKTRFTLFGYPGLAMLCFLLAAGGGFLAGRHYFVERPELQETVIQGLTFPDQIEGERPAPTAPLHDVASLCTLYKRHGCLGVFEDVFDLFTRPTSDFNDRGST